MAGFAQMTNFGQEVTFPGLGLDIKQAEDPLIRQPAGVCGAEGGHRPVPARVCGAEDRSPPEPERVCGVEEPSRCQSAGVGGIDGTAGRKPMRAFVDDREPLFGIRP
jgi:hypothetical protein